MKYLRLLILSLFIHLLIYYSINLVPPTPAPSQNVVEIEIPDQPKEKIKQRGGNKLTLPDQLKSLDTKDDEKKENYFAEKIRVKEETNARIKANETVNRKPSLQQLTNTFKNFEKTEEIKKVPQPQDMGGDVAFNNKKQQKQNNDPKPLLLPGMSTTKNTFLDDTKIGDFTALNADQHLFYTFHRRISDTVKPRWEDKVYSLLMDLTQQGYGKKLASKDWTTEVEIILNGEGYFQRFIMDRTCGIQGLDAAFVQAFKEASPFLNPPAEMRESDGNIHLKYRVTVRWGYEAPPVR